MFDIPMDLRSLEKEIVAYEQEPIETGKILVYGHSLFTRWGSGKWVQRVRPWAPRALVLANWGNDSMYGYSPEQSMHATAQLLAWARTAFPGIKLFLVEPHLPGRAGRSAVK